MTDEIKIQAEPLSVGSMCRFTVDRPVFENRSFFFGSREAAEVSPLAKRIFDIPGVAAVLITHNTITVTKFAPDAWQFIGKQVGMAIRSHITCGDITLPEEIYARLPSPVELRRRVEEIIEREVAPAVASHGGSVRVVDVKENVVMLQLGGGCQGCSSATATLKFGVEAAIRRAVPEIGEIIDTTNHAAGANPYMR